MRVSEYSVRLASQNGLILFCRMNNSSVSTAAYGFTSSLSVSALFSCSSRRSFLLRVFQYSDIRKWNLQIFQIAKTIPTIPMVPPQNWPWNSNSPHLLVVSTLKWVVEVWSSSDGTAVASGIAGYFHYFHNSSLPKRQLSHGMWSKRPGVVRIYQCDRVKHVCLAILQVCASKIWTEQPTVVNMLALR